MSESIKEILGEHTLFSLLPDAAQDELLGHSTTLLFKPEEKLISEGEFNEYLYFIIGGTVKISNSGETIATVEGHKIVGEISSSGMSSPVADVIADTDVTVLAFPLNAITDISIEHSDFAEKLREIGMKRFD
ncbi:MAG: cyclic nucleotide-binding domain-containing protein [Mariprofundaceae bacterium]